MNEINNEAPNTPNDLAVTPCAVCKVALTSDSKDNQRYNGKSVIITKMNGNDTGKTLSYCGDCWSNQSAWRVYDEQQKLTLRQMKLAQEINYGAEKRDYFIDLAVAECAKTNSLFVESHFRIEAGQTYRPCCRKWTWTALLSDFVTQYFDGCDCATDKKVIS